MADDWVTAPAASSAKEDWNWTPPSTEGKGDWITAPTASATHPEGAARTAELYRDLTPQPRAPRTTAADIQQGVAHGLVSGGASVLGFPADLWNMIKDENKWALTKGAEKIGLITPEHGEQIRQSTFGSDPLTSDYITKHVESLARATGRDTSPTQTIPGQYAETAAAFIPQAAAIPFAGGAPAAQALRKVPAAIARYGVLPALTSETAGQATKGTAAEPYARVAGAIGPEAMLAGIAAGQRTMNPVNRTLSGVTPAQETEAQRLLDQSRAPGSAPLTVPEAIDQATGTATNIGDVARVVEQSPRGGPIMKPFFAERPGQVENLGRATLDEIAPGTIPTSEIGPRVQSAADATVGEANAARTAAVDPFYQSAKADRVPAPDMDAFLSRIDSMIASDKTGIMGPELSRLRDALTETPAKAGTPAQRIPQTTPTGAVIYKTVPAVPPTPRVPVTDIENLDRARKYFRDRLDLPQWAQDATSKEEGAKINSLLGDLRQRMVDASPDFRGGKNLYQQITDKDFNPLVRSPTGQLAKTDEWGKQADIILANNPDPRSQFAVAKAVRDVAAKDPDAARELARARLEKTFNEATQANVPGANQFGAPKFWATIMGNPQQARNLEAVTRALPDGDTRWTALRRTMDIFEAMGKRQAVGSKTAFNTQLNDWIKAHPDSLPIDFVAAAASPGRWPVAARDLYHQFAYGQKTAELARVFTEGNVSDLKAIVGSPPKSARGQAAVVSLLARRGLLSGPSAKEPPP